jgi:hypothetical protein
MFAWLRAKLIGDNVFESMVPYFNGKCYPIWLNKNQALQRLEGPGVTGFFKQLGTGREFHGILWTDNKVWSGAGVYTTFRGPENTISTMVCDTCDGHDLECPECHGEGQTSMSVFDRAWAYKLSEALKGQPFGD